MKNSTHQHHQLKVSSMHGHPEDRKQVRVRPNPSIERTCSGTLRVPTHAAHVER
jgi:hypothetical protein